jgi:FMN phosphatase YigB (HAD superfamily)
LSYAFFDLDDTLVDSASALRAWSFDFVTEYGLKDGEDISRELCVAINNGLTWHDFVANARIWYGITTEPDALLRWVADVYSSKFTLDGAAASGLTRLREAGLRIGIVTNGATLVQAAKIARTGLGDYVDVVVDAEEAGFSKPDRRIFEVAAARLDVELGLDGWMVGNDLEKDVGGGLAAGLQTIWLPCGRPLSDGAPRPDFRAASIEEAIDIVVASPRHSLGRT